MIQTWCARCDLFESSHMEVLCDATNETFVSDMLCRDSKEFVSTERYAVS
jgi:hypothetical protein